MVRYLFLFSLLMNQAPAGAYKKMNSNIKIESARSFSLHPESLKEGASLLGLSNFQFNFQDTQGKIYPLLFSPADSVAEIKRKIEEKYHKSVHKLFLKSGIPLRNNRSFKSYRLAAGDPIIILFKPPAT